MLLIIAAAISVSTPAQLPAAIARAKPGDEIVLAPGSYGTLALNAPAGLTLRSADPKRRALFSRITANNPDGLTVSSVEVSYTPAKGEGNGQAMVRINNGRNVNLDNLYVHGVLDGQVVGDANGVSAFNVDGLTVANSRLVEINAGIKAEQSRGVIIRGNDIGFIGSDAIDIPGSDGVTIAWNTLHDFRTNPGVHPDGIQCWTTRQPTACKNVRIISNQFIGDAQPGSAYIYPQGIWFGDEMQRGDYTNIEITGNLFRCVNWQAIALYVTQAKGTIIRFNRIDACPGVTPWIRINDPGAVVEGNVAPGFYINSAVSTVPAGNYLR